MSVFRFRVLIDSEEDVFRDIDMLEDHSFEDFHYAIQESYEFDKLQMASFYMSNDNWDKGEEVALMDMSEDFGPEKLRTMTDTRLKDLVGEVGDKLVYVYDFMLMWCFFVELIAVREAEEGEEFPILVNEYGKAPEQYDKESPLLSEAEIAKVMNGQDEGDDDEDLDDEISDMFSDNEYTDED